MDTAPINFDPNLNTCGQFTQQTVRMVFGLWDARLEVTETATGNVTGMSVIESAILNIAYRCEQEADDDINPSVTLTYPNGDALECDGNGDLEGFLADALIFAEILSIEPCASPCE